MTDILIYNCLDMLLKFTLLKMTFIEAYKGLNPYDQTRPNFSEHQENIPFF